jgi:hypothetical protein
LSPFAFNYFWQNSNSSFATLTFRCERHSIVSDHFVFAAFERIGRAFSEALEIVAGKMA